MENFVVRRCNEDGKPDAKRLYKISARTPQDAAETVCGMSLTANPRPQLYCRADVQYARRMGEHHTFYAMP